MLKEPYIPWGKPSLRDEVQQLVTFLGLWIFQKRHGIPIDSILSFLLEEVTTPLKNF